MNIRPVKTETVPLPARTIASPTPQTASPPSTNDTFDPAQNEKLVNMLQQQPDVRPDAVQRAQALAADPNYPSLGAIASLAKLVIAGAGEE
jgi:hypothetical protein